MLGSNRTGADRSGMLAGVMRKCMSIDHLDLSSNSIGDDRSGRLGEVLGECKLLTHLKNYIRDEEGGKLAGALGQCWLIIHLILNSKGWCGWGWEASRGAGPMEVACSSGIWLHTNFIGNEGTGRLAGVLGGSSGCVCVLQDVAKNQRTEGNMKASFMSECIPNCNYMLGSLTHPRQAW